MLTSVILLAAGRSERFGAARVKTLAPLAGRPLVLHSLLTFDEHSEVDEIVLVAPPGQDLPWRQFLFRGVELKKLKATVAGGERRQDSVGAGLGAISEGSTHLLIHDAARPLVSAALISAVLAAASEVGAAAPLVPVQDTVKRIAGGRITGTAAREELGLAQTPQAFRTALYREAFAAAASAKATVTDDAGLLERASVPVAWVEGAASNLKVTTPEDLEYLEWHLAREREAQ